MKRKVLFLCTENSARSQMAEAIVNARWGDRWQAFSAGTYPTGFVHPLALRVLAEIGIDHSSAKPADKFREVPFDLVVTVCDDAAQECPVWLGQVKRVHLSFSDPAKATGSEDEVLAVSSTNRRGEPAEPSEHRFRAMQDQIVEQVGVLLGKQG